MVPEKNFLSHSGTHSGRKFQILIKWFSLILAFIYNTVEEKICIVLCSHFPQAKDESGIHHFQTHVIGRESVAWLYLSAKETVLQDLAVYQNILLNVNQYKKMNFEIGF